MNEGVCSTRGRGGRRRARRAWVVLLGALFVLGAGTSAHAQSKAEGRAAAQKAGTLAAEGRCAAALPLYDKAHRILRDPAILFNRAECLLKVGRAEDALRDYRRFLDELPAAPNRALVEERIATVQAQLAGERAPAEPPPLVAPVEQPAPAPAPAPVTRPARAVPVDSAPAPARTPARSAEPVETPARVPDYAPSPMPSLDDGPASSGDLGIRDGSAESAEGGSSPWLWIGAGALVVAGAVVAGLLLFGGGQTEIPQTSLGNHRF